VPGNPPDPRTRSPFVRRPRSAEPSPTSPTPTSPIWLGQNFSVCARVIERLYGNSHLLNDAGQYAPTAPALLPGLLRAGTWLVVLRPPWGQTYLRPRLAHVRRARRSHSLLGVRRDEWAPSAVVQRQRHDRRRRAGAALKVVAPKLALELSLLPWNNQASRPTRNGCRSGRRASAFPSGARLSQSANRDSGVGAPL
jgi:hypothetical protein